MPNQFYNGYPSFGSSSSSGSSLGSEPYVVYNPDPANLPNSLVLTAGSNITISQGVGTITISASGGSGGGITSVSSGNLSPIFTSTVNNPTTTPAISFTLSNANANTFLAGPTSGSAATPAYRALNPQDLPLAGAGGINLSSNGTTLTISATSQYTGTVTSYSDNGGTALFSTSVANPTTTPTTTYSLTAAGSGTLLGNFTGTPGAPTYNAPGTADQVLGVNHTSSGLEYKTISGAGKISVTPSAGNIQIATTATLTYTASAQVNFGVITQTEYNATTTVPASWVTSNTILVCTPFGIATPDHDPDDYFAEGLMANVTNIVPGVSFDVAANCPTGTWGRYTINIIGL